MSRRIVLASNNRGKLAEFGQLLSGVHLELKPMADWQLPSPAETGASFVENAIIKARYVARATGLAALADDSGLCVAALDGAPGVHSAVYAGEHASDQDNTAKLLQALAHTPANARSAYFICVLVLLRHPEDPRPLIAEGIWSGRIASQPSGQHGFGYDPVFIPDGETRSAAELPHEVKHAQSHRGKACERLREALRSLVGPVSDPQWIGP